MYKKYYTHFINANPGKQHYACHSHHYWPDVTREATIQYWDDAAKFVDDKWDYIFGEKIPTVQRHIAKALNLSHPEQIAFAPNTHEFVGRILSCFEHKAVIKVVTTDSEFYSFDRQINRLIEADKVDVVKVPSMPFETFEERMIDAIEAHGPDLVFFSHVFFNSGVVVTDLERIVNTVKNPETLVVIDGYHGFMAIPTDLSKIENRIFYIAGSYKYAQGGEGNCFLYSPKGSQLRPLHTGWFAGFGNLAKDGGNTGYSDDGYRFAGSTMDFAALYRLEAVFKLFESLNLDVTAIHNIIKRQQANFIQHIASLNHPLLKEENILVNDWSHHGHFITFNMPDDATTAEMHDLLKENGVLTDYRGNRLRFGFAIYHEDCIDLSFLKSK